MCNTAQPAAVVTGSVLLMVRNTTAAASIVVTTNDIAKRAYEMYLGRGRAHGFDRDDWLRAERELRTLAGIIPGNGPTRAGNVARRGTRAL